MTLRVGYVADSVYRGIDLVVLVVLERDLRLNGQNSRVLPVAWRTHFHV